MPNIPRESTEFIPVEVTVDGAAVTTGVQFAVIGRNERPSVWTAPVTLGGKIGVMVGGYAPGDYYVWARIQGSPEVPVIAAGSFRVS